MSEAAAPTAPQLLLTHFAPRGSGLGIADLSTDPMGLFGTLGTDIHACSARGMKPLLYDTGTAIEAAAIPQVHGIHQRAISGIFSRRAD
ncbi:hypothetical protein HB774_30675 (plasmid) [Rhizobium leguminosarum bv. viciae]|nr:hypothetical protein HB774_30675 [Rhizobium leguminosarum bv. viciae]